MKKLHIITSLILLIFFLIGCQTIEENIETEIKTPEETLITPTEPEETIISPIPTIPIQYDRFLSPHGFAELGIEQRNISEGYIEVHNEIEFLQALMEPNIQIIEIKNDLNMGANHIQSLLESEGLTLNDVRTVYRRHSHTPLKHPTLIENGVGSIRIVLRNHLMIYSTYGATISHATTLIDGSNDIVIRNLKLTGIWEWDELDRGQYKRNDWDYFTIEKSSNIWIDHMTFEQAYDGIIDIKENTSNVTLSWSKLLFKPNTFIEDQINYLEEQRVSNPFYDELRTQGVSIEDIILHSSFQKKGFNLGNTTDGLGFESITMTFHHLEIYNLQDRMPRIRKGDVHMYHVSLDNQDVYLLRLRLGQTGLSFVNQGIVTTEDGAVLMENSIFKYVTTPLRNHQDSNPDSSYTGRYQVINSELILPSRTYFGSSEDTSTLWRHDNSAEKLAFRFRNYDELPYHYTLSDVYFLNEIFERYPVGHTHIENFDWTDIRLTHR